MRRRQTRPGEAARPPLELAVALRFKHHGDFVDELSSNLSAGGMFVRTRTPHPVGSVFEFELRLDDSAAPIAGKAQVVWVRRRSDEEDRPVGMGVRFVEVDDDSRRHIGELVAAHEAGGKRPPEVEPRADAPEGREESPAAEPAEEGAAPAASVAVPSPRHPTPKATGAAAAASPRPHLRALRVALPLTLAAALFVWLWQRPTPPDPPAPEPAPVAAPAPAAAPAPIETEPAAPAEPDATRAVRDWARSWSEQRVDDYLAAYSPAFRPEGGLDRATWEGSRRARILAPQWIEIGLAFVEVEAVAGDRRRVSFVQAYESDSYRDVVRKVVVLERVDGAWKILEETVEP